ncbi:MAG: hypothetical protein JWM93_2101 [Frankiales bacterium]|nr:hypothetical protein [Frankiales bacterium]
MRSFTGKAVAFAAAIVVVCAFGAAASAAPQGLAPCKAGAATSGCTRAWVSAGCDQFKSLVKATLGAAPTSATRSRRGSPRDLICGFKLPGDEDFAFIFASSGATAAVFASVKAAQPAHIVGCQAAADPFDASTQTKAALPKALSGIGDQAFVYYPCPGGFVAYENSGDQQVLTNVPSAYARRGATSYSATGANAAQLSAFMRQLLATYH